jgi:squalene-associated FAD-dependent desaturase
MLETDNSRSVIVVGGGWAGLSCAVELSRIGYKVTVLESAKQLGGRARRTAFKDYAVDNGQHVLVGAYRQTLRLLSILDVSTVETLVRTNLDLHLLARGGRRFNLHLPSLLTPLNLFVGLLRSRGFTFKDRWRALMFGFKLFTNSVNPAGSEVTDDLTVAELLAREKQTENNIRALWEPICLASLNTTIDEASAAVFVRVLHDSFCRARGDSDLIIPKTDLGRLLPDPALDFIESHGGNIHLSKRVTQLSIDKRHVTGVSCGSEQYMADHVILAIPPYACTQLVKDHPALHDVAYNLSCFSYNPIVTVYIKYPKSVKMDNPVQALLGTTSQWIIDRQLTGQPGLMAVVISGPGSHMEKNNDELVEIVKKELAECYPHWPGPDDALVIREKRATFNCRAGINSIRPENRTRIDGLWLSGDFTQTGYPATLESAVISGQRTAAQLHHDIIDKNYA